MTSTITLEPVADTPEQTSLAVALKPLIILPTYNEIDNLQPLVEEILDRGPYHVLVVDDNSPDGTGELADKLAEERQGRVFALHRKAKEGLGRAYNAGFKWGIEHGY